MVGNHARCHIESFMQSLLTLFLLIGAAQPMRQGQCQLSETVYFRQLLGIQTTVARLEAPPKPSSFGRLPTRSPSAQAGAQSHTNENQLLAKMLGEAIEILHCCIHSSGQCVHHGSSHHVYRKPWSLSWTFSQIATAGPLPACRYSCHSRAESGAGVIRTDGCP